MASTAIDRLDGLSSSAAIKGPCRVATTANITLSGLQTIDGVTLAADDRVLVKNQTDTVDNGIYIASVSGWRRSRDFYGARDVIKGTRVYVNEGTTNAASGWIVTSANPIVVGTSNIVFSAVPLQPNMKEYADAKFVSNRTALKAIDTTVHTTAVLAESGRAGLFQWRSGDYSAHVTADTLEGVYIKADAIASSSGAWVRSNASVLDVAWFGALNDGSADAQPAIQAAIDLAEALGSIASISEGPVGHVFAKPGRYLTDDTITFSKSIVFRMEGTIRYTPTTGRAVLVTDALTSQHTFYDIYIKGIRAVNGNGSIPTSINASGCTGIELRRVQFSHIHVGQIIAFTKYGAWLNSTNDAFTGQHIQDNDLSFDQLSYCGAGLLAESVSAADGACQVNRINIQNSFSNFRCVDIGASGDNNTNHNILNIEALDAPGSGGSELRVFARYNDIKLGFVDTAGIVSFESGSLSNRIWVGRNYANVAYNDAGTDNTAIFANGVRRGAERFLCLVTGVEPISIESTDETASFAQLLELYKNSATPADNDGGIGILAKFKNAVAAKVIGGRIRTDMPTVASGNENLRWLFDTIVGGALANRMVLWQGLILGSPTSGDKGAGTLNTAGRIYQNNNAVPYRLEGSKTFDPTSLADGAGETTTVTVTGAALGDMALASFSLTTSGITITAWVSAADTVSVRFQNESGGVLDIGSGTLKAWVLK